MTKNKQDKPVSAEKQSANETKQLRQRRLVIGGALGASVLAWQTPMVKSVILPAHAQTSEPMVASYFAAAAAVSPVTNLAPSLKSPLDLLIPPAVAQLEPISEYTVGIAGLGGDEFQVDVFERRLQGDTNVGEFLFSGMLTLGAAGTLAVTENPCEEMVTAIEATLADVSPETATLTLTSRGEQLSVPAGMGTVPTPVCVGPALAESYYVDNFPIDNGADVGLLDLLIPPAHAGQVVIQPEGFRVLATMSSSTEYEVTHRNITANAIRVGRLNIDGSDGSLAFVAEASCDTEGTPRAIPARILSVDEETMVIQIDQGSERGGMVDISLPAGSGVVEADCRPR